MDRERTLNQALQMLLQPLPGFTHHWHPELLQATQNVLANELLEAEARGLDRGAAIAGEYDSQSCYYHDYGPCCHVRTGKTIREYCEKAAAALRAQIQEVGTSDRP